MARTARSAGPGNGSRSTGGGAAKPRAAGTAGKRAAEAPGKRAAAAPGSRAAKTTANRAAKTPARGRAATKPAATPRLTRDELQARVTKLERDNERLRLRGRESTKSAKDAAQRIEELEAELRRMERRVTAQERPARRKGREIDPGDSVPSGVAVQDPEEPDEEARAARESLEEHLHGGEDA